VKVKISYTVDYEDVPNVINNLVVNVKERLRDASELKSFEEEKLDRFVVDVQAAIETVSTAGSQLTDLLNMAVGYVTAEMPDQPEDSIPEQEDQSGDINHE
jgi:hypothetical protein